MNEKTIRDSNFELLRIVLIVMIICLHYLGHGGSLEVLGPSDFNFYFAYAFESFFIIAVNCFILITGIRFYVNCLRSQGISTPATTKIVFAKAFSTALPNLALKQTLSL